MGKMGWRSGRIDGSGMASTGRDTWDCRGWGRHMGGDVKT